MFETNVGFRILVLKYVNQVFADTVGMGFTFGVLLASTSQDLIQVLFMIVQD